MAQTTGQLGGSDFLRQYGLPEGTPQEQLRAVTRVASTVCGVPNAVVNLLDECFQHQVGSVGVDGGRSDVADSMCVLAMRDERLRHVPDARLAEALLRAEGADVVTVADGDEAVRALESEPLDLVLLDMRMPRMSGPDAARAIRALPGRAAATPVFALTASTADEDRAACLGAGMQGVLVKPVRRAQLRTLLEDIAVRT